ncbi:MAG TPA: ATP-binding cassette domain-containing protein, partial [Dehalococcoidia bacterium]|nr:ATP-binding cassette domain-containing protein [Dehalococcoidia bacterium]
MLYAEGVVRTFGARDVLDGVEFIVSSGERAGLVGPNGAGKSTLLKLLAGEDQPDAGRCGYRGDSLGYLRQEAGLESERPLFEEMWTAFPEARAIERRIEEVSAAIEAGDGDIDALVERQGRLFEEFEALDGYRIERRIGRVLDGLGFGPGDRQKLC